MTQNTTLKENIMAENKFRLVVAEQVVRYHRATLQITNEFREKIKNLTEQEIKSEVYYLIREKIEYYIGEEADVTMDFCNGGETQTTGDYRVVSTKIGNAEYSPNLTQIN